MLNDMSDSLLGKETTYPDQYQPDLLFGVARSLTHPKIDANTTAAFFGFGFDIWNAYEVSWLNNKGKPMIAIGQFIFPANSPNLIESKSFKLYLNSINNITFQNEQELLNTIKTDLAHCAGAPVSIKLLPIISDQPYSIITVPIGICLDDLDIDCHQYTADANLLTIEQGPSVANETLFSNLFRSNCPVTHQPDWASIQIVYSGRKINHANLLRYLVSFRKHTGAHETCIEQIFVDIMNHCKPDHLTVNGYSTRRGGLDINSSRSTDENIQPHYIRQLRQ